MVQKNKKKIIIEVDEEIHTILKVKAAQKARTITDILTELVRGWLKRD